MNKKQIQSIEFAPLLQIINKSRNSEVTNLRSKKQDIENNIKAYKNYLKNYKADLKRMEKQLASIPESLWEAEDLLGAMNELKKHKFVDWAMITKDMKLIVQTTMLYQFNAIDNVDTKERVGRYAFSIDLRNYFSLQVFPLDFVAQSYRHPNLMTGSHPGNPCWGGLESDIKKMIGAGEFYLAIDAMILFHSTFPQEGGHQPLYWMIWLNERKVEFRDNPWFDLPELFVIGTKTKAKKVNVKVDKKETVTLAGKEYAVRGLQFRGY